MVISCSHYKFNSNSNSKKCTFEDWTYPHSQAQSQLLSSYNIIHATIITIHAIVCTLLQGGIHCTRTLTSNM